MVHESVRPPVGRAIAAAALAAALGAAAWAVMVIVTDHSFGLAAAGLGILGTEFSPFYLLWVGFGVLAAWRIVGPARRAERR